MPSPATAAAPTHLVLLGLLLFVWHVLLALDYVIARFGLAVDLPSVDIVFTVVPGWAQVGWALGIWLGLVASIFAMMRDDAAVLLFFAAFVGMLVAVIGAETSRPPAEILGLHRHAVFGPLVLVPLVGWIYTRSMKRARVLH
jgi:hypothetical protein